MKSKLVQLLSASRRQSLSFSADYSPIDRGESHLFMGMWNATMTLALLVHRQIAQAFLPVVSMGPK